MADPEMNRYATTQRHGLTWALLTAVVAIALIIAGLVYSTGMWSASSTKTDSASVQPGPKATQPGVPNSGKQ
jgi:hypothetical protein